MSPCIVQNLKPVKINEQHAKVDMRDFPFRDAAFQKIFRVTPIADLGEGVGEAFLFCLFQAAQKILFLRIVAEYLHRAHALPVLVKNWRRANGNGHSMTVLVSQEDIRFAKLMIFHRRPQRTAMPTEIHALPIDVVQQIVRTTLAQSLFPRIPADAFRAFVPIGDAVVSVYEIDSIIQMIQQQFRQSDHKTLLR